MDEVLPEEFNVILIGTGLSESVLSGALSRINKKVLHFDHNDYYGGDWASFNIKAFDDFLTTENETIKSEDVDIKELISEDEEFIPISRGRKTIFNGKTHCYLRENGQQHIPENEGKNLDNQSLPQNINKYNEEQVSQDLEVKIESELAAVEVKSVEKDSDKTDTDTSENQMNKPKLTLKTPNFPSKKEFFDLWRRFNIDLSPKVMFSRGLLVELLIQSNVARYLEFRNITRTLTLLEGSNKLQPVPCSRADVFSNKFVNVIEKRILMRVLTFCNNYQDHRDEYSDFVDKPFSEFLKSKKLSNKVLNFIIHSIAMVNENASTKLGLEATQKFLRSLGRYGNSAFLFSMYGVGEIPQAFCRLSAVFGGTFCLRRYAVGVIVDKETNQCKAIIDSKGHKIKCNHLILDEHNVPDQFRQSFRNSVSRAVYVTNQSLVKSENEQASLITVPPTEKYPFVRLYEVGPQCCVCPSKYYVVHAMFQSSTKCEANNEDDLSKFEHVEKTIFSGKANSDDAFAGTEADKPVVLWAAYFTMHSGGIDYDKLPSNVHVTKGPEFDLGFDGAMKQARDLFSVICPEEEFLPRAPDPEEIVFDDEGYSGDAVPPADDEDGDYAEEPEDKQRDEVEKVEGGAGVE